MDVPRFPLSALRFPQRRARESHTASQAYGARTDNWSTRVTGETNEKGHATMRPPHGLVVGLVSPAVISR